MEFGEAVAVTIATKHEGKCPFCPLEKIPAENKVSYIGEDNKSTKLEANLKKKGDPKQKHLYVDSDYGRYSAEAHHLICGNEVLKEEGEVECFLITESKKTGKGQAGYLQPNDVGYDVNSARNGIWLPSVPDMFRVVKKKDPDRWWGDQKVWNKDNPDKDERNSVPEQVKAEVAFLVMQAVKRQFHKGPHGNVGEPHNNYVVMAINRLRQVTVFLTHFANICPMDDEENKKGKGKRKAQRPPPYYPPNGIIMILDLLSDALHKELIGDPASWNYFISEYALQCANWCKDQSRTPVQQ